jgi:hypothetical protein
VITVGANPPTAQAETLVSNVVAANLATNVENSLLANLQLVGTMIDKGLITSAIQQLNAFIQKVETYYAQGSITYTEEQTFISLAQTLINSITP